MENIPGGAHWSAASTHSYLQGPTDHRWATGRFLENRPMAGGGPPNRPMTDGRPSDGRWETAKSPDDRWETVRQSVSHPSVTARSPRREVPSILPSFDLNRSVTDRKSTGRRPSIARALQPAQHAPRIAGRCLNSSGDRAGYKSGGRRFYL